MLSAPKRSPAPSTEAAPLEGGTRHALLDQRDGPPRRVEHRRALRRRAWGLSLESVQALELIVPGAILGGFEVLPVAPKRVQGDANARREDRFVAMGRGALIGASFAVLTEATYRNGFLALGRLLAPAGASHVEAADRWWTLVTAVALSVAAVRLLPSAAQRHFESRFRRASSSSRWPQCFTA